MYIFPVEADWTRVAISTSLWNNGYAAVRVWCAESKVKLSVPRSSAKSAKWICVWTETVSGLPQQVATVL